VDGVDDPHDDDEDLQGPVVLLPVCGEVVPHLGAGHWARSRKWGLRETRRRCAVPPQRLRCVNQRLRFHEESGDVPPGEEHADEERAEPVWGGQKQVRRARQGTTDVELYEDMAGGERGWETCPMGIYSSIMYTEASVAALNWRMRPAAVRRTGVAVSRSGRWCSLGAVRSEARLRPERRVQRR
jgi:hypothetical protein